MTTTMETKDNNKEINKRIENKKKKNKIKKGIKKEMVNVKDNPSMKDLMNNKTKKKWNWTNSKIMYNNPT